MSKGDVATSPAQAMYEQAATQQIQRAINTWLPVQSYFAQRVQQNQPGLQAMAAGTAAATARAQGGAGLAAGLRGASDTGAAAGSGRFLMAMQRGGNAIGGGAGIANVNAQQLAQQHWVRAMQDIIGTGQSDQATALQGFGNAAQAGQAYEQERAQLNSNSIAGLESTIGTIVALAAVA